MSATRTITVVLYETVTRDEIDDARWEHRWLLGDILAGGDDEPARMVLYTRDSLNRLTYVHDTRMEAQLFMIDGLDPERAAEEVRGSLRVYTDENIASLADRPTSDDDLLRGLYYTLMTKRDVDGDRVFEVLERGLGHARATVRMPCLTFAFVGGGQRLRAVVAEIAASDADTTVAQRAADLLQSWREEPS